MKPGRKKNKGRKKSIAEIQQYFQQALHYFSQKDYSHAKPILQKILKSSPNHADANICLGMIAARDEDFVRAEYLFKKAANNSPDNPTIFNNLGNSLKNQGKDEEALASFKRALSVEPEHPGFNANLGNILVRLGRLHEASDCFEKALKTDQENVHLLAKLGSVYEQANRYDEALTVMDRAVALDPNNHSVKLVMAKIELRKGNTLEAKEIIESLLETINPKDLGDDSADPFFLLGAIYNKLGDYTTAFAHYSRANQTFQLIRQSTIKRLQQLNEFQINQPSGLLTWFTPQKITAWSNIEDDQTSTEPVFMIGFSRSGTTLLDQILDSHPAIKTLEEKPTLEPILQEYCSAGGQKKLATLSAADWQKARNKYWQEVNRFLDSPLDGRLLVDRNPFGGIHLGHIHRFFPKAKILVALRDPRDVVLSNFMQSFALNPPTANFLSLENTARYYAAVMELLLHYRQVLQLNIHSVYYENLVDNLPTEARKIIDFLELDWDEKVLAFHETAQKKSVRTASYHQVIKPIYKGAVCRWKKYEVPLKPILPILQPYVDIFEKERQVYL